MSPGVVDVSHDSEQTSRSKYVGRVGVAHRQDDRMECALPGSPSAAQRAAIAQRVRGWLATPGDHRPAGAAVVGRLLLAYRGAFAWSGRFTC